MKDTIRSKVTVIIVPPNLTEEENERNLKAIIECLQEILDSK